MSEQPTRRSGVRDHRGYFVVGIEHTKTAANVGTLWRTADLMGAAFMFTVGHRYREQPSDTMKSWRNTPLLHFETLEGLASALPYHCQLVGVELDERAVELENFTHPIRACYLLGAEDHGLSRDAISRCHSLIQLRGRHSMNVAVAGSIVLYHRRPSLLEAAS